MVHIDYHMLYNILCTVDYKDFISLYLKFYIFKNIMVDYIYNVIFQQHEIKENK